MKCDSWASLLACTFASPFLGHEPKIKVATESTLKRVLIYKKPKFSHLFQVEVVLTNYLHWH
jgi:hypothetical protein